MKLIRIVVGDTMWFDLDRPEEFDLPKFVAHVREQGGFLSLEGAGSFVPYASIRAIICIDGEENSPIPGRGALN